MADIESKVSEFAKPICDGIGASLVDVEYTKEGEDFFLRVFVDTPNKVTIDEIVKISERLSASLDEEDFIRDEYVLEVASPGAERPLKSVDDIKHAIGSYINVQTHEEVEGVHEIEGDLQSFDQDILTIEVRIKTRKKTINIDYSNVKKSRLAIKF